MRAVLILVLGALVAASPAAGQVPAGQTTLLRLTWVTDAGDRKSVV